MGIIHRFDNPAFLPPGIAGEYDTHDWRVEAIGPNLTKLYRGAACLQARLERGRVDSAELSAG